MRYLFNEIKSLSLAFVMLAQSLFKPRIFLSQIWFAWRRVNKRKKVRKKITEMVNRLSDIKVIFRQIVFLCILSNKNRQLNIRQISENCWMPFFRKTFARWESPIFLYQGNKIHRDDSKHTRMIKGIAIHT